MRSLNCDVGYELYPPPGGGGRAGGGWGVVVGGVGIGLGGGGGGGDHHRRPPGQLPQPPDAECPGGGALGRTGGYHLIE